jgi:hypothetical protein
VIKQIACAYVVSDGTQRSFRPLRFWEPPSAPSLPARIAGKMNANWAGRLSRPSPYCQSRSAQRADGRRLRSPRPCRASTKRRARRFLFARQLLVSQATTDRLRKRPNEPSTVIRFALVVPKRLFVEVAEQMERLDADIGSFQTGFSSDQKFSMLLVWMFPLT